MPVSMPRDKIAHHLAGAAIALAVYLAGWLVQAPLLQRLVVGALLVLAVAASKECFDQGDITHHTVDWLDFAATIAGGAYALALLAAFG